MKARALSLAGHPRLDIYDPQVQSDTYAESLCRRAASDAPTYFPHRKLRSLSLRTGIPPARYKKYVIYRIPGRCNILPGAYHASSCLQDIL